MMDAIAVRLQRQGSVVLTADRRRVARVRFAGGRPVIRPCVRLEHEPGKEPKYNLDGLQVGDLAPIDEQYLDLANRLCGGCVTLLACWAES